MSDDSKIPSLSRQELEAYSAILDAQDICLERIELLLYRMEYLAILSSQEQDVAKREGFQKELVSLQDEIDKTAEQMNPHF